jgi:hypothetical protein
MLNYNEKHVMKLLEFYSNLKDKIEDDNIVRENFQNIFTKFKKNNQNSTNKDMFEELEKKFFAGEKIEKPGRKTSNNNVDGGENKDPNVKRRGVQTGKRNFTKMKKQEEEDSDEDQVGKSDKKGKTSVSNNKKPQIQVNQRMSTRSNKKAVNMKEESDADDDYDDGLYSD